MAIAVVLLAISSDARADVVWPALMLESRLLTWWAILAGLTAEYLVFRRALALSIPQAVRAVVGANLASTLAGVLLIPLAGIVWEIGPGALVMWWMDWGTFNPVTWTASVLLAVLVNAVIEAVVLKRFFSVPIGLRSRRFLWLLAANGVSVGLAAASLWLVEARM